MKRRKVTILAHGITGSERVEPEDASILFVPLDGLVVNEKPVHHHGFEVGLDDSDGFLFLTIKNVEEEDWVKFMADEDPDDVMEGTGIQQMGDNGEVESLLWFYGANIVLPVHELEIKTLSPTETPFEDWPDEYWESQA